MALDEFLASLEAVRQRAQEAFAQVADEAALEVSRIDLLGAKSGRLRAVQKEMGGVDKADKPVAGKRFNEVKTFVETAHSQAIEKLAEAKDLEQKRLAVDATQGGHAKSPGLSDVAKFDPTLPGKPVRLGHLHPITQTIRSMKEIMGRLGFSAVEGPEVEDDWHNFEALNIPRTHPARDPLDNFYLATSLSSTRGLSSSRALSSTRGKDDPSTENSTIHQPMLLRSQTSTVQIRVMESCVAAAQKAASDAGFAEGKGPPPVRIISLGRVYRPDTADATHYPMFHQIEGLLIDQGVTMADLKSILRLFYQSYFRSDSQFEAKGQFESKGQSTAEEVHVRFRTSFFPFTEPSVEVDMNWQSGWMEMGGAGMVDPNVLSAVGYDPEEVTGFAFGLGVERICMRQHGITDIRDLYQNDIRFLQQF